MADLPPEWEITNDDSIIMVDCESPPVTYIFVCNWGAAQYSNPVRIVFNINVYSRAPLAAYGALIHEATHAAHKRACYTQSHHRKRGISRNLLHALLAHWQGMIDEPWPDRTICAAHYIQPWWERVPPLERHYRELQEAGASRPVGGSYGLRNFWEYVAVTVTDWFQRPGLLKAIDPEAYAAIEEHGLAAD